MKPIVNQYLNDFIISKKLKINQFASIVGVERQSISKWIYGAEPQSSNLKKIKNMFPDFDYDKFYESLNEGSKEVFGVSNQVNKSVSGEHINESSSISSLVNRLLKDLTDCNLERGRLLQENETLKKQLKIK